MSASNNTLNYNDFGNAGYIANVSAAARGLLQAVFAVKPRAAATAAEQVVSQRNTEASVSWLKRLADDCERHSPSLSAELHFMASRG